MIFYLNGELCLLTSQLATSTATEIIGEAQMGIALMRAVSPCTQEWQISVMAIAGHDATKRWLPKLKRVILVDSGKVLSSNIQWQYRNTRRNNTLLRNINIEVLLIWIIHLRYSNELQSYNNYIVIYKVHRTSGKDPFWAHHNAWSSTTVKLPFPTNAPSRQYHY